MPYYPDPWKYWTENRTELFFSEKGCGRASRVGRSSHQWLWPAPSDRRRRKYQASSDGGLGKTPGWSRSSPRSLGHTASCEARCLCRRRASPFQDLSFKKIKIKIRQHEFCTGSLESWERRQSKRSVPSHFVTICVSSAVVQEWGPVQTQSSLCRYYWCLCR